MSGELKIGDELMFESKDGVRGCMCVVGKGGGGADEEADGLADRGMDENMSSFGESVFIYTYILRRVRGINGGVNGYKVQDDEEV